MRLYFIRKEMTTQEKERDREVKCRRSRLSVQRLGCNDVEYMRWQAEGSEWRKGKGASGIHLKFLPIVLKFWRQES